MAPTAPLSLYLDLGDVFTKGLACTQGRLKRLRFPSAVAHELVDRSRAATNLVLDELTDVLRPTDFDPNEFPRARSYPGGEAYVSGIQRVPGARFAGWLAAAFGADRVLLGNEPTEDNVDALVHKALLESVQDEPDVNVIYIVDMGAKADLVSRYASASPRVAGFQVWTVGHEEPETLRVAAHGRVVDGATCAVAALPSMLALSRVQRVLMADVGYLRTKLTIVSNDGCEHQQELDGLGVADCIRRIMRDEQNQGLVEDELAVMRALERSRPVIEIEGRRFNVGVSLDRACRALETEVGRAIERTIVDHCDRTGEMCRAVAVVGGGAHLIGERLVSRVEAANIGVRATFVASNGSFFLIDGAYGLYGAFGPH